jgi:hypothetical protein
MARAFASNDRNIVMKRSRIYTTKLALGHAAIRELKLGELKRIDGGSSSDSIAVSGEPAARPPEEPRGGYVLTC